MLGFTVHLQNEKGLPPSITVFLLVRELIIHIFLEFYQSTEAENYCLTAKMLKPC